MSEELNRLEGQHSSQSSELSEWQSFLNHSCWGRFSKILEEQANTRAGEILLKPLESMDKAGAQEFMKGEVAGLKLALTTPLSIVEQLKHDLRVTNAKLEKEHELSQVGTDDAGGSRVDDRNFSVEPESGSGG